jgi:ankyrin repeat protein
MIKKLFNKILNLIIKKPDIKLVNAEWNYNIIQSAKNGDLTQLKHFIQEININVLNDLLRISANMGCVEIVEYLVENGADIHAENDVALRGAAFYGNLEVVKYLTEHGANIHVDNEYALRSSYWKLSLNVFKYLIEQGANIHVNNEWPLRIGVQSGDINIVKYLIEHGADLYTNSDEPLKMSSANGHLAIVNYLVVDCDMEINENTLIYLQENNCIETIRIINNRDLRKQLESNLNNHIVNNSCRNKI